MRGSRCTACAPPKKRLRSENRTSVRPSDSSPCGVHAGLDVGDVVLDVDARRVDRVLDREAVVEHPDHHLEDRRADPVRPGRPQHQPRTTVPEHHRRRHHRRQPATRRVGVEPERREVLLAHHVVQVDAGAGHHLAAALAVRARHRAGPTVAVGRRYVRRRAEPARGELLEEAGLRKPARNSGVRSACARAIASTTALTVGGDDPRSSCASACARRIPPALGGGFVTTVWPAVGDLHGRARDRLVRGQVGGGQQPAALGDPGAHRGRQVAGVERRRPLRTQPLERVGERRIAVHVADARRPPGRHEVRPRLGGRGRDRRQDLEQVGLLDVDHHAAPRGLRGGRRRALARDIRPNRSAAAATPATVPYGPAAAAPMLNTWTASPKSTSTASSGACGAPGATAAARRLDEEVEQHGLLARRRHEHVAAGAEPGQHRLGDERREHRRQRGVHGVAARAERVRAGLGGDGMARGDDAAHRSLVGLP